MHFLTKCDGVDRARRIDGKAGENVSVYLLGTGEDKHI